MPVKLTCCADLQLSLRYLQKGYRSAVQAFSEQETLPEPAEQVLQVSVPEPAVQELRLLSVPELLSAEQELPADLPVSAEAVRQQERIQADRSGRVLRASSEHTWAGRSRSYLVSGVAL